MTHDELLAKIAFDSAHHLREALRAVVELHKPMKEDCECDREHIPTCEECVDDYPCPTIQTIEKVLV
jgi:hypothetical protein